VLSRKRRFNLGNLAPLYHLYVGRRARRRQVEPVGIILPALQLR
jgi:hypothetical protein